MKKIKRLWWNIQNIIKWIPVLYDNYDWDHVFLLRIMEFKLQNMAKFFEKDAVVDDASQVAIQLRHCLAILHILITQGYEDEAYAEYYKKYPMKDNFLEETTYTTVSGKTLRAFRSNMTKEQKDLFMQCAEKSQVLYKNYKKALFDILENNLEKWWD